MKDLKINSMSKFYALCIIYEKKVHGYELIKTISEKTGKKVSPGQIYPFLTELENLGYVKCGKREKRDKLSYSLTKDGKKFCKNMLSRFGELIELAIEPSLSKCASCGCEVYKGGYIGKVRGKEQVFCCSHCYDSLIKNT